MPKAPSQLLLRPWPLPVLLALRYLRSTRKDAYVSFLSTVAAAGIAVGVAALVLVLAALSGLHERLLGQILATTPQIEITLPASADPQEALLAVEGVDGISQAQRVLKGQGWVVYEGVPEAIQLVGFEGSLPPSFPGEGTRGAGLYVPRSLADRWLAEVGSKVQVVSPRPSLSPLGPRPRVRTVLLEGVFESSPVETFQRAALPLDMAEALLGREGRVIQASSSDAEEAVAVVPALQEVLPEGARVQTWKDLNRSLYFVLRLEKTLLFVAVGLIVVVAALALVVGLALVISSKRSEIGMLGAMGVSAPRLRSIFLWLGLSLSTLGLAAGCAIGALAAWLFDRFELLVVPGQVMFVDYIPFRVHAGDIWMVCGATAILVALCSLYAGHRAATLKPVEALRR
ncbi:MAG: FtsX-like permease family protein [Deltaproteobacteria bacterium]|nr:FtsX-like permease family protein [Deltaproteobacteria bacterium]